MDLLKLVKLLKDICAKYIYGKEYKHYVLELNISDQIGINI